MADSFESRNPTFNIGQHDSTRDAPLTETEYGHLLNHGVSREAPSHHRMFDVNTAQLSFVTTPVTNNHFRDRVFELVKQHLDTLDKAGETSTTRANASRAEPILPPLTPKDTSLFPSAAVSTYTAYISPWIDLSSTDPIISSISRQVLNLEINYANFCGVKSIVILGPQRDASPQGGNQGLAHYSRAVEEALTVGSRLTFLIHIPMYREPGLESQIETLSVLRPQSVPQDDIKEIDLFTAWDSWHHIRTVCNYDPRLYVGMFTNSFRYDNRVILELTIS